jgi:hypothetical protein
LNLKEIGGGASTRIIRYLETTQRFKIAIATIDPARKNRRACARLFLKPHVTGQYG